MYRTPRFKYGQRVECEVRGTVEIVGLTDARIPWPVGKKGAAKSLVVYRGLAAAVRRESNKRVCELFGITGQTVTKWRRALGVPTINRGTLALKRFYGKADWFKAAQRKAWAKARDPQRRAKIAAAKWGKPRPLHVRKLLRTMNRGRKLSADHRRKMSDSYKRRGTRPPAAGRAWEAWETKLVATLPASEVA